MRYIKSCTMLIIGLAIPSSALGQHPINDSRAAESGCAICHDTHGLESGLSALSADALASAAIGSGDGLGPGPTSLNCLRCHTTAEQRSRQDEFSHQAPTALHEGKYLNPDLSDDHPLGSAGGSGGLPDRGRRIERLFKSRAGSRIKPSARISDARDEERIECITCHDPHARTAKKWTPDAEWALCNTCHDPASYSASEHARIECSACHSMHGGHDGTLLAEYTADMLCRSCHDATNALAVSQRPALLKSAVQSAHPQLPEGSCLDCHSMHR